MTQLSLLDIGTRLRTWIRWRRWHRAHGPKYVAWTRETSWRCPFCDYAA